MLGWVVMLVVGGWSGGVTLSFSVGLRVSIVLGSGSGSVGWVRFSGVPR